MGWGGAVKGVLASGAARVRLRARAAPDCNPLQWRRGPLCWFWLVVGVLDERRSLVDTVRFMNVMAWVALVVSGLGVWLLAQGARLDRWEIAKQGLGLIWVAAVVVVGPWVVFAFLTRGLV